MRARRASHRSASRARQGRPPLPYWTTRGAPGTLPGSAAQPLQLVVVGAQVYRLCDDFEGVGRASAVQEEVGEVAPVLGVVGQHLECDPEVSLRSLVVGAPSGERSRQRDHIRSTLPGVRREPCRTAQRRLCRLQVAHPVGRLQWPGNGAASSGCSRHARDTRRPGTAGGSASRRAYEFSSTTSTPPSTATRTTSMPSASSRGTSDGAGLASSRGSF